MFKPVLRLMLVAAGFSIAVVFFMLAVAWWWPADVVSLASHQLLDVRTAVLINLEVLPGTQVFSSWSPDGRWLALSGRTTDGNHATLYTLDVITRVQRSIAVGAQFDWLVYPLWSPDNQYIGFTGAKANDPHLYVVSLADGELQQITRGRRNVLSGYLSWSPDSQRIAFVTSEEQGPIICIASIHNGTDVSCPIQGEQPDWSPDGEKLVYKSGGIYLYDLNSGEIQQLTREGNAPTWSPDGAHIAYVRVESVIGADMWEHQLYLMNADGTNQRVVARPLSYEWAIPTWSSDSRRLFSMNVDGRTLQITDIYTESTQTLRLQQQATLPLVRPE